MIIIDKGFLEENIQEIVNEVEASPFILPQLFMTLIKIPKATVAPKHKKDKLEKKMKRTKEIYQIFNSDSDSVVEDVRRYHEIEFLEWLDYFPQFDDLIKEIIFDTEDSLEDSSIY